MKKTLRQKSNQKINSDEINHRNFAYRIHKHRIIVKIIEIVLFILLFVFSAALALAAPITSENVENLVNQERANRGLIPLKVNDSLNTAAEKKSTDMVKRNYFDHYAYGISPWVFIQSENYDYLYAGENLAMDFDTAEGVVSAWMASPSHRKNILNSDFDEIGVGVVKGEFSDNSGVRESTLVTNMFATKKPAVIRMFDNIVEKIKNIF